MRGTYREISSPEERIRLSSRKSTPPTLYETNRIPAASTFSYTQTRQRQIRLVPSLEGDSGSTWYDAATFTAKGLHVAIDPNSNPPAAIATLTAEIVRKMKLTWI